MIVADTSFWINHWKLANLNFVRLLTDGDVLMHPFVLGELALGSIRNRKETLSDLGVMEQLRPVSHDEIMLFVEARHLFSRGIGYVDTHLLASCVLHADCRLLTNDRRLNAAAAELGIAA